MKNIFFAIGFLMLGFLAGAQKYAVIDTRYILDRMPEYKAAQQSLDRMAAVWQTQIDSMQVSLDKMYRDFEAEQVMLTPELKKRREDQLFAREKELRDLQRRRFGFEGYDFVLDKSEGITVIFADPKLDKSEDVLRELGIK
jgi:outer membrane protein